MKKVLLGTAAVAFGLILAAPAKAEVKLDLAGHFKGYVFYTDQDDLAGGAEPRAFDIVRDTEIHFTGETTLDNGLTVGFHTEADIDDEDTFTTEESYAYFSGSWGRVNFGKEDGAAYLLQVAAPSADDNYDGIRQYVSPFNTTGLSASVDYANDVAVGENKITYLTPVFSGFQAGVSYTPELGGGSQGVASNISNDANDLGDVYEAAVRYDGQFDNVGFTVGAGYELASQDGADGGAVTDDLQEWNVGLDLNWSAFGLGAVYTTTDSGTDSDVDTWVVGADYTTGPYKLGVSYLNQDADAGTETDRYTGGVVYTYGPGLTFRGSVSYVDVDAAADSDGTSVLLGTQINF